MSISKYGRCEECGEHLDFPETVCPCKEFTVIDDEEEEHIVHAKDKQDAALKYAAQYNTNHEYSLMNDSAKITVDGTSFNISAEPDVNYQADEI